MSDKEEIQNLSRDYRSYPNYEPPIRWYQFWRYHRFFSNDYHESRCADKFLKHRIEDVYNENGPT